MIPSAEDGQIEAVLRVHAEARDPTTEIYEVPVEIA
jgi:hypothetical protein